jgi:beta-1,4-mannosyl-glycoprotein beta-1,4-N-acetylglucosaminyltransferase
MKLIDVFLFNDELDMLEARLEYLYDHVDRFVLIEGDRTFTGVAKPFHFEENKDRYSRFADKISAYKFITDEVFDLAKYPWAYEKKQRNYIGFCLDEYNSEDIIMVSDLDEIPNRDKIEQIKETAYRNDVALLHQEVFSYNLNTKLDVQGWIAAYAARKKFVLGQTPDRIRKSFGVVDVTLNGDIVIGTVMNAGWHLANFMTAEKISEKISNSCHFEFNTNHFKDVERIQECIDQRTDLYERDLQTYSEVDPEEVFSEDFLEIFEQWK